MSATELKNQISRAETLELSSSYDAAMEELEAAATAADAEGLVVFQAVAIHHTAKIQRIKGQLDQAEESARRAVVLFTRAGDDAGQAESLLVLAEIQSDRGQMDDFERTCVEALALSRQANSRPAEARALTLLGTAAVYRGRSADAMANVEAALSIYRDLGDDRGLASGLIMLGRVQHMVGHVRDGASSTAEAMVILENLGDGRAMASASYNLGLMDLERGDLEGARQSVQRSLAATEGAGEVSIRLRCLILLSQVLVESGRYGEAITPLREAQAICSAHDQKAALPEVLRVMAQANLGAGSLDEVEREARLGRESVDEDDTYSKGTTSLVLALVLERRGRTAEAHAEFRKALEQLQEAEEAFEIGWSNLAYGRFLLAQGDRAGARAHLLRAREAFVSLEAQGKVELINALLNGL